MIKNVILVAVLGLLITGGVLIIKKNHSAESPVSENPVATSTPDSGETPSTPVATPAPTPASGESIELALGQSSTLHGMTITLAHAYVVTDTQSGFELKTKIKRPGVDTQLYTTEHDNATITSGGSDALVTNPDAPAESQTPVTLRITVIELGRSASSLYDFDPAHVKIRYTVVPTPSGTQ